MTFESFNSRNIHFQKWHCNSFEPKDYSLKPVYVEPNELKLIRKSINEKKKIE